MSMLRDANTGEIINLPPNPYEGLTHFPKGSALEGLRIPTRGDARRAARNILEVLKNESPTA